MELRMRGLLSLVFLPLAATQLLACANEPRVEINNDQDAEGILVSGRGEIIATPDTGRLTIGVEVTRDTVVEARRDAAAAAQAVIGSIKANGVADKDLRTTNLSISPRYEFVRDVGQRLVGYVVTNSVSVTVRNLDTFSKVVDDAVEAGGDAARLQEISFDVEDRTKALEEARVAAMKDARAKADLLADTAGVSVGRALNITEVSSVAPTPLAFDAAQRVADEATPVQPGTSSIVVEVQVRWAIE